MRRLVVATLAVLLALPGAAQAEASLHSYEAVRDGLLAVWAELPLTARNATLTSEPATGYGAYTPLAGTTVEPGAPIHVYVELLGYGWRDNGDGSFSRLIDADLSLVDAEGTTLATQPKFLSLELRTRDRPLETYLTLEATLTAFAPGPYRLTYVLHDRASGKEARFELPITLAAP
jgi:hypothetical protein